VQKIANIVSKLLTVTPEVIEETLLAIIRQEENNITDLNTQQLFEGINSDGSPIEPEYSQKTVRIKTEKGQPTDRVTLRDTGDFYRGLFLSATEFPVLFGSLDEKALKLETKYGEKIFGLTEKNKDILSKQIIKEKVQQAIVKLIQV
jgi:hypothetical protein